MSKRTEKRRRFRQRQKQRHTRQWEHLRQAHLAEIAPLDPARILYLPLDIGKNVHWASASTGAGHKVWLPQELLSNHTGYDDWAQRVHGYLTGGDYDLLLVGHEPTGIYHEAWGLHLCADFAAYLDSPTLPRLHYRWLNPYQVKLEREQQTLSLSKSDPVDLAAIGALLQQGYGTPARLPTPELLRLRQAVYLAHRATAQLKATRIELLRLLDRIWPGAIINVSRFRRAHPDLEPPVPLVTSKPLERQRVRFFLEHLPNPYDVRALNQADLIATFHEYGLRCGVKTAQQILTNVHAALLQPPEHIAVYVELLQELLTEEAQWQQRQHNAQHTCLDLLPQTPARHLLTLHGLPPLFAAYYLDLLGSPPRFAWADQVWKYVGFDVICKQSGDSTRRYTISRRGATYDRHTLTWMTLVVAGHHPTFGQTFIAAEERGHGVWGAAIHTAHKLNRVAFSLIADDRPYQDTTPPEDFPRWRQYWLAYRRHRKQPRVHAHPGSWQPTR